jgi:hypothetical protein
LPTKPGIAQGANEHAQVRLVIRLIMSTLSEIPEITDQTSMRLGAADASSRQTGMATNTSTQATGWATFSCGKVETKRMHMSCAKNKLDGASKNCPSGTRAISAALARAIKRASAYRDR